VLAPEVAAPPVVPPPPVFAAPPVVPPPPLVAPPPVCTPGAALLLEVEVVELLSVEVLIGAPTSGVVRPARGGAATRTGGRVERGGVTFTIMSPNCSGSWSRPSVVMGN